MTSKQLLIYLYGKQVGILKQTDSGRMIFTYVTPAAHPLSIGMPIRDEPYGETITDAFFGGLLPESETTRKLIGRKFGISPNNNFSLLRTIGYDCAGAVSCYEMDAVIDPYSLHPLTGRIISENELYQHIMELPKQPLFLGIDGLRLSLAGVQDKAAVCLIDNQIALAENGCPTTHILKPSSSLFEGLVENEYFCLKIAKRIGLPVPDVKLYQIKDIKFLLIERYDRKIENRHVARIHQEDFCQALGILSTKKYQNEGGPSFLNCFNLLKETAQPVIDRNILASALVFNFLIGNMDAHGKNFSLLHQNTSLIKLAPLYDIVCTQAYPDLTSKMAMKIGGKYDAQDVLPKHWEQLCKDIGYRYISMKETIINQAELILQAAREEKKLLTADQFHPIIDTIIQFLNKKLQRTIKQFK